MPVNINESKKRKARHMVKADNTLMALLAKTPNEAEQWALDFIGNDLNNAKIVLGKLVKYMTILIQREYEENT